MSSADAAQLFSLSSNNVASIHTVPMHYYDSDCSDYLSLLNKVLRSQSTITLEQLKASSKRSSAVSGCPENCLAG